MHKSVDANQAPKAVGNYPHARQVGELLILSGIGPRSVLDNTIPGNVYNSNNELIQYDISAQCHAVFANVIAVLEACGATLHHLVDVTVYLTNMEKDFPIYNKIWAEYFPDNLTAPCRTTLGISALPTAIAIELKCIATVGAIT